LDTAYDAIPAGRGGDLEIIALVAIDLNGTGKIERHVVAGNLDRLERVGGQNRKQAEQQGKSKNQSVGVKSSHLVRSPSHAELPGRPAGAGTSLAISA